MHHFLLLVSFFVVLGISSSVANQVETGILIKRIVQAAAHSLNEEKEGSLDGINSVRIARSVSTTPPPPPPPDAVTSSLATVATTLLDATSAGQLKKKDFNKRVPKDISKSEKTSKSKEHKEGDDLGDLRDDLMVHGRDRDQLRRRWKLQDGDNRVASIRRG